MATMQVTPPVNAGAFDIHAPSDLPKADYHMRKLMIAIDPGLEFITEDENRIPRPVMDPAMASRYKEAYWKAAKGDYKNPYKLFGSPEELDGNMGIWLQELSESGSTLTDNTDTPGPVEKNHLFGSPILSDEDIQVLIDYYMGIPEMAMNQVNEYGICDAKHSAAVRDLFDDVAAMTHLYDRCTGLLSLRFKDPRPQANKHQADISAVSQIATAAQEFDDEEESDDDMAARFARGDASDEENAEFDGSDRVQWIDPTPTYIDLTGTPDVSPILIDLTGSPNPSPRPDFDCEGVSISFVPTSPSYSPVSSRASSISSRPSPVEDATGSPFTAPSSVSDTNNEEPHDSTGVSMSFVPLSPSYSPISSRASSISSGSSPFEDATGSSFTTASSVQDTNNEEINDSNDNEEHGDNHHEEEASEQGADMAASNNQDDEDPSSSNDEASSVASESTSEEEDDSDASDDEKDSEQYIEMNLDLGILEEVQNHSIGLGISNNAPRASSSASASTTAPKRKATHDAEEEAIINFQPLNKKPKFVMTSDPNSIASRLPGFLEQLKAANAELEGRDESEYRMEIATEKEKEETAEEGAVIEELE